MEDFLRACHDTIKDNEPKSLAAKMGLPHVSLLQRSNPDNDAHHLTIEHLFGVLLHTGDVRPLKALAAEFGFDLVAKESTKGKAPATALIDAAAEFADVTRATHDALLDGHVSSFEKSAIRKEIAEVRQSLDVLEESVKVA